jgi:hypothetical protein
VNQPDKPDISAESTGAAQQVQSSPQQEDCPYNLVYEKLVNGENDVVGLVAYGIYKRKKVAFVSGHRNKHNSPPSQLQFDAYHKFALLHLDEYKKAAESVLFLFGKEYYDELAKEAEDEIDQYIKQENIRLRKKYWCGFASGMWQSACGSILFALVVGVLYFVLTGNNVGVNGVVDAAKKNMQDQTKIESDINSDTFSK